MRSTKKIVDSFETYEISHLALPLTVNHFIKNKMIILKLNYYKT